MWNFSITRYRTTHYLPACWPLQQLLRTSCPRAACSSLIRWLSGPGACGASLASCTEDTVVRNALPSADRSCAARVSIFPTTGARIAIHQLDLVLWLLVAARCYRLAPPSWADPRGLVVWRSIHAWRYGVRIPGAPDTFRNAIGRTFFYRCRFQVR